MTAFTTIGGPIYSSLTQNIVWKVKGLRKKAYNILK